MSRETTERVHLVIPYEIAYRTSADRAYVLRYLRTEVGGEMFGGDYYARAAGKRSRITTPDGEPITRKRTPRAATVRPPHASKPKRTPGARDAR